MLSQWKMLAALLLAGTTSSLSAQIITDGSLGPSVTLRGDSVIEPELGQQRGNNLFHSFERFDLGRQESALFSGEVAHIFARVTGAAPSRIDGFLAVEGDAHLWMINPQGLIFGEDSLIDASGGFSAFAGEAIEFADGARFHASLSKPSTLSSVSAAAWGLVDAAAPVIVNGEIVLGSRAPLNLVGSQVQLSNAQLSSPDGNIQLLATQGQWVEMRAPPEQLAEAASGDILLRASFVDAGGTRGGRLQLTGARVVLEQESLIQADARGDSPPQGQLLIHANEIVIDDSALEVDDLSSAPAGADPGDADAIALHAAEIDVRNGSLVSARKI